MSRRQQGAEDALAEIVSRAFARGRRPELSRAEIERGVRELRRLQLAPDRRILAQVVEALGVGRPSETTADALVGRLLAQTIARLESLPAAPEGPLDLPELRVRAEILLRAFLLPGADCRTMGLDLRPQPGDYALVFAPAVAERAQAAYAALWADPSAFPAPKRGQSGLTLELCWSQDLCGERRPALFPEGYQRLGGSLLPERAWVAWKFVAPRRHAGMAFNGLVWLDGRWAFFPKPYRVLRLAP